MPILVLTLLTLLHLASSKNKTSKDWAVSAQNTIWETSQVFQLATMELNTFNEKTSPKLSSFHKITGMLDGAFGAFGALFSIIMAFIPGGDSPEFILMKSEFGKLSQAVDTISRSLDDTKDLIKIATQKAAFVGHEQKIHYGYSQMEACLKKLENVSCTDLQDCKRKKILVAEDYISSMDVRQNIDAILRGVISDSAFGTSLLALLQEDSNCNLPKINLFTNKVHGLIFKAISASMFHDLLRENDYNILDDTVVANTMFQSLESNRQAIQDSCFSNFGYWVRNDVNNAHNDFSSDIQNTSTILLRNLKRKYPWIHWHVFVFHGEKNPVAGPSNSIRKRFISSSKDLKVHCFVIPTTEAHVQKMQVKINRWKEIIKGISISGNLNDEIKKIEEQVENFAELEDQIQSFAILPGDRWILGHFKDYIKQVTLGVGDVVTANVLVSKPYTSAEFYVAVSFNQKDVPPRCSNRCNGKGDCFVFPYSSQTGCNCMKGLSGDQCDSSETSQKLRANINILLQNTMKLPTFASLQHTLDDVQLYLQTSAENLKDSIMKLESKIDEKFKSFGEFMSDKFDWFSVLLKYKDAIENLNYFHSISSMKVDHVSLFKFDTNATNTAALSDTEHFSLLEEKEMAKYLLNPVGIQKWLYQLNFLIVGRRDSQFNSHQPLIFMVMNKYKNRLCFRDYKDEVTRTYRQLMLLQLRGYILWSEAYDSVNRDSSVIAKRYNKFIEDQKSYLQSVTCTVKIPHSKNVEDCSGGFYIHKTLDVNVTCKEGYFPKG